MAPSGRSVARPQDLPSSDETYTLPSTVSWYTADYTWMIRWMQNQQETIADLCIVEEK
jgi:hypothetical protein